MLLAALLAAAVATTGGADSITTSTATLTGTVNPGGVQTAYHFEYGTSASYGLATADSDAGAGSSAVSISAGLGGLTPDTTYHYRLVATNAGGGSQGADRTFRTAAAARAPSVSSVSAAGVGPAGATLRANVTPNGLATTVRFEYGASTSYGASTAEQPLGAGTARLAASAPIAGLKPNTRYHYRAVATNAAGVTRGGDRTFTTSRTPTAVALTPSTTRPVWGSGVTIAGKVSGQGSIPVALERQDFPFSAGYRQAATATANRSGSFTLTVPALYSTTRLRVVTRTAIPVTSPVVTASVAVKVGLRSRRLSGKRVRLTGATWPAVPSGRVSLQRQTSSGRWLLVKRAKPTALSNNRSRYRFTVSRRSRALSYRVVVVAHDAGAHVPGTSRTVRVPRR
ncbi:hypothetical protein [Candidatus Solirubrobacter pratensis]|uniref:hypothetical protein n=1 Tax=Candidatus Solirubrobacter pratensis TaxID=1298857 RepID=UPI000409F732|nr:hypothetical protein [Candidatus Solirubrobacter pratensis]